MREFAAAGGGEEAKTSFFLLRSRQHVYKSVESESLWRKEEGATAGIRQKNKKGKGSSHRSSLARRPVILRVARAQHPYSRRAPPSCLTLLFCPVVFVIAVLNFFFKSQKLCFIHTYCLGFKRFFFLSHFS